MELKNKSILITGASSGIGRAVALKIAGEGMKIALLARRIEQLKEIEDIIRSKGSEVLSIQCSVAIKKEVYKSFETIKNRFGKIDIALLNSGVSYRAGINKFDSSKAAETFSVNVMGIIYCVEALLPDFKRDKEGMIIGVSSLAESRGFPGSGFYCASKAAASIFLESLRVEGKRYNIKVLTVKPGFIKTPMTDKNEFKMPFLMDVEEAADIIIRGIKKEKRIIQFPLPTVLGAKLLKIIPDALFDKLMTASYKQRHEGLD